VKIYIAVHYVLRPTFTYSMTPQSTDSPVETDYEIAQNAAIDPIWEITEPFGLSQADVDPYGRYKAKLTPEAIDRIQSETEPDGKLVLVTGMTPTPMGEGKTVTAVGLGQALTQRGYNGINYTP